MNEQDLPPQDVLRAACLRPGRPVELILATDLDRDLIDVRSSVLHDLTPQGHLILAQTQPPTTRSYVGRPLEVTFLARYHDIPGGRWLRVGYQTPLKAIKEDYRLGPDLKETVLIVAGPKKLTGFTLRLDYRLEPSGDCGLQLCFWPDRTPLTILDISAGGVRFSHAASWSFEPGQQLNLAVINGPETLLLKARVKRSGQPEGSGRGALAVTAAQFEEVAPETRRRLGQILQEVLRIQLARRAGLD